MSENKHIMDQHEEKVDSITDQRAPQSAVTNISNGSALTGKERMITSELEQPLQKHEENLDSIPGQGDAQSVGTGTGNGLAKAAILGAVGAVLGTVAVALASKVTDQRINGTVKGVGDAVKGVAKGVNHTVKGTVDRVRDSIEDAKVSAKDTVNREKDTVEDAKVSDNQTFKLYEERLVADKKKVKAGEVSIGKHVETETAHISVPLQKERVVVERIVPVDVGTPVDKSEVNFYEGEIARIKVYEELPDVQKVAFVREEISVRKEVERSTVEVEDKIRREELDLDIQDTNVSIDETKTL